MKIVHVIWAFGVGGSESMLLDIVNEQSKTHDIHLVVINNIIDNNLRNNISKKVKCHFLNRPPGSLNPVYMLHFNLVLLKIKPDIVHCHEQNLVEIFYFKFLLKTKLYLTVHNTNIPPQNFRKYNKLFAISNAVKQDIFKNSNLYADIIPNGIPIEKITTKNSSDFKIFKIIQVGRLDIGQKGQDISIKALSILKKKYKINHISIDFIGEGESKEYLIELTKKLGMMDHCIFLGKKSREFIYQNLKNYNLLIQPSRFEGFGLTVAEGMAAKIPVLVSNIEGPMEIINNGELGYHFKSNDCEDCAETLIKILKDFNDDTFKNKIDHGFKYIKKRFNIQNTAIEYLKNY